MQISLISGQEVTLLDKRKPRREDMHSPSGVMDVNQKHVQDGIKEAQKNFVRERITNDRVLSELVNRSQTVLFTAQAIFPFDLFPDEMSISLAKVTVVNRSFFSSGSTQSVYIKDIMDVIVDSGPFFATLKIIDVSFNENKLVINYLSRSDALRARIIIEGLTIASKMNIDLTKVNKEELIKHIEELGKLRSLKPA